jgi:hypothetical protein
MKSKEARELIELCRNDDGYLDKDEIEDLVIWAYDKGWTEAIKELVEEDLMLNRLKKPLLSNKLLIEEVLRRFPKEYEVLKGEKND